MNRPDRQTIRIANLIRDQLIVAEQRQYRSSQIQHAQSLMNQFSSAAKKLEKNRQEEEEAEQSARALQQEANEAFEARLAKRETPEVRSFEEVQKDLLKALKRLDKAVESASEETGKSQDAYRELLSIITPSH